MTTKPAMAVTRQADPILCVVCHYGRMLPWERHCEACALEDEDRRRHGQRARFVARPSVRLSAQMKQHIDEALKKKGM